MPSLLRTACLTPLFVAAAYAAAPDLIVGHFSAAEESQPLQDWQPYTFDAIDRHTQYQLIEQQGTRVVKAESRSAASGLIKSVNIDLQQYPLLSWRWRVYQRPSTNTDRKRAGDDHAARLYLIFNAPDPEQSMMSRLWNQLTQSAEQKTHAINYIWANQVPINEQLPNPYTNSAIMLAVDSGDYRLGEWVTHIRNVVEDYRAIFGRPPPPVSAVAIMTDTDNTESSAIAYYGDIVFSSTDAERNISPGP